ncbi:hypothetical protein DESUT3_06630 [Desulfuromonas versatilis]|uniref:HemY N-terminal domain-containing protein n=1 Tax=Desulfuromonas versatilis TaxID=2802975 RepID=A0ABM8HRM1_9BACT|nr:lipopolysaccharide assembly protein LapA domain-containing protein [Desulfuromonas versatilis]BCR03594.1 hypothetical protein DESUT3_06630 [Desulfuromonas versatilis]
MMIILAMLLVVIVFLAAFIYFLGLNPQEVTIFFYNDFSLTSSVAVMVVACILVGLALGFVVTVFTVFASQVRHWKSTRRDKKAREITNAYQEGMSRLVSGDTRKAQSLLQKALDRDPKRIDAHIALADVHAQAGDAQQGLKQLLKARDMEPANLEVLFKLATAYEATGQPQEAVKTFEQILAGEPANRKALAGLRDLRIRLDQWSEALDLQKKLAKASQGNGEEQKRLVSLRYEVVRKTIAECAPDQCKAELKELNDIIRQDPQFVPARVTLGDAYKVAGRREEASKAWQQGYRATGKAVFLSRLEDLFLDAEDPSSLLAIYRGMLADRGDDLMFRLFYGKLCLRLEMVDEALEQLSAVENAGVQSPKLHLLLAEAHRRRNRPEDAMQEYKKALGVDKRLHLGYACESCGATAAEWQSRCGACGSWGSFSLEGRQIIQQATAKAAEAREIHHGERAE